MSAMARSTLLASLRRDLKIEPWQHTRIRELELYVEQMGEEKLARQVEIGMQRFRCCWNVHEEGHHALCPVGKKNRG